MNQLNEKKVSVKEIAMMLKVIDTPYQCLYMLIVRISLEYSSQVLLNFAFAKDDFHSKLRILTLF